MKKSPSDTLEFILKRWNIAPSRRNPIEIPNIDRWDLAKLFFELDMNLGAEIGVLFGRYSKILCETNPKLKLFSIDPWQKYNEYKDLKTQKDFDDLYEKTKTNLAQFNCKIIRKKAWMLLKISRTISLILCISMATTSLHPKLMTFANGQKRLDSEALYPDTTTSTIAKDHIVTVMRWLMPILVLTGLPLGLSQKEVLKIR